MQPPKPLTIPRDIIDLIFEQISQFSDNKERRRTLAATALVSWYFRHRAHARLFSEVYITNCAEGVKLRDLLHANPHSALTGMASYIRTLVVEMHGLERTIRPLLDDGTLAAILRFLFRSNQVRTGTLRLAIRVQREDLAAERGGGRADRTRDGDDDQELMSDDFLPFNWDTLSADCAAALRELVRESHLTTLHLAFIDNLPRLVLRHSRIRHLEILQVRLAERAGARGQAEGGLPESIREYSELEALGAAAVAARQQGQAVFLESLSTDHSIPLLELIDATPNRNLHPKLAFSHLVKLTSHITDNQDFHKTQWILLNAAATLTTLEVALSSYNDMLAPSWDNGPGDHSMDLSLNTLPSLPSPSALRKVTISQQAPSFPVPLKSSLPAICQVMNQVKLHPLLEDVEIAVDLFSEYHPQAPLHVFHGHDLSPLDRLFGCSGFATLRRLMVHLAYYFQVGDGEVVDAERLRLEGERCVRAAFVESAKTPVGALMYIDIQIYPVT